MTSTALVPVFCLLGITAGFACRWLWVQLRHQQTRWRGRWTDGNDPARRRVALGAKAVTGPVVYHHYDHEGRCAYVGQALVFARRAYQEGKEHMSDAFASWVAIPCPRRRLDEVEAEHIAQYEPYLNRTRGNGRRNHPKGRTMDTPHSTRAQLIAGAIFVTITVALVIGLWP